MAELPTTFGKYYLTEKLATGGMAEIYLGKLIGPGGFEKPIVIKQIHPRLSGQRHFVDLFVAEAKTLVSLAHGNIVPVYELGVIEDTYFIAMDYIDGPTLYRLTERMAARGEHVAPAVAAWIAARILEGLDYAHRKGEGVIHRDLSPRNVMLSRDGEVKLVDFGIAVTLGEPGEGAAAQSAPTGSYPYMSPEQVRKEPLTPKSDLFTVGVLLWEMLAGERLFARPDADATLAAVQTAEIRRPSAVRPEVPEKLDEIAMRALERDPGARWPAAGEFLAALNKYLYSLDATPGPREVAALVATFCPPESRRQPTHVDPEPDAPKGPATKVVPRGSAAGRPKRHQTFATHVELEGMLAAPTTRAVAKPDAAPPLEMRAAESERENAAESEGEREPEPVASGSTAMRRPRRPDRVDETAGTEPPRKRERPGNGFLIFLGAGAVLLSLASIYMFYAKRDDVLHGAPDAAVEAIAPVPGPAAKAQPSDAGIALAPVPVDAAVAAIAAPSPDAPPLHHPGLAHHADAGVRTASTGSADNAGSTGNTGSTGSASTGTATLRLGASPWGEVYVDGKKLGRAPHDFTVTAGHHDVQIVFPAVSPPLERTFSVDIRAGETQPFMADFQGGR